MSILVLDLGGSAVKFARMSLSGEFEEKGRVPSGTGSVEELHQSLEKIEEDLQGIYEGVAVSMPGCIDMETGIAHTGGSYQFIKEMDMTSFYREIYGKPVMVANDGKCAVRAEAWKGALKNVKNGAVIAFGTGIAGGLLLNGKVWMGNTYGGAELSFLPVDFDAVRQPVTFGKTNLSSYWAGCCSTKSLLWHYAAKKHLTEQVVDGFRFFKDLEEGDQDAEEVFRSFARSAAAGVFAIQSILELDTYAIGGGISARLEVTEKIRAAVDEAFDNKEMLAFQKPKIVPCAFRNDANLIGALGFYLDRYA